MSEVTEPAIGVTGIFNSGSLNPESRDLATMYTFPKKKLLTGYVTVGVGGLGEENIGEKYLW